MIITFIITHENPKEKKIKDEKFHQAKESVHKRKGSH